MGGRTSGTRAKGVHGPGKGFVPRPPKPYTAEDVRPETLASNLNDDPETQAYRQRVRLENRADLDLARQRRRELLNDKAHFAHWSAIKDVEDRIEGPIVQKQEVKGNLTLEALLIESLKEAE